MDSQPIMQQADQDKFPSNSSQLQQQHLPQDVPPKGHSFIPRNIIIVILVIIIAIMAGGFIWYIATNKSNIQNPTALHSTPATNSVTPSVLPTTNPSAIPTLPDNTFTNSATGNINQETAFDGVSLLVDNVQFHVPPASYESIPPGKQLIAVHAILRNKSYANFSGDSAIYFSGFDLATGKTSYDRVLGGSLPPEQDFGYNKHNGGNMQIGQQDSGNLMFLAPDSATHMKLYYVIPNPNNDYILINL